MSGRCDLQLIEGPIEVCLFCITLETSISYVHFMTGEFKARLLVQSRSVTKVNMTQL